MINGSNVVSMKVCDEDLVEAAWSEAAPHQLHLTALPTVKHPQARV